jgi:hypothetical protein
MKMVMRFGIRNIEKEEDGVVWNGLIWLRIRASSGLLWTR